MDILVHSVNSAISDHHSRNFFSHSFSYSSSKSTPKGTQVCKRWWFFAPILSFEFGSSSLDIQGKILKKLWNRRSPPPAVHPWHLAGRTLIGGQRRVLKKHNAKTAKTPFYFLKKNEHHKIQESINSSFYERFFTFFVKKKTLAIFVCINFNPPPKNFRLTPRCRFQIEQRPKPRGFRFLFWCPKKTHRVFLSRKQGDVRASRLVNILRILEVYLLPVTSWWLSHPIWKNMNQIGSLFPGMRIKRYLSCNHRSLYCISILRGGFWSRFLQVLFLWSYTFSAVSNRSHPKVEKRSVPFGMMVIS